MEKTAVEIKIYISYLFFIKSELFKWDSYLLNQGGLNLNLLG